MAPPDPIDADRIVIYERWGRRTSCWHFEVGIRSRHRRRAGRSRGRRGALRHLQLRSRV